MNFIEIISGKFFLNYIGGILRFIYGTIWRTIFNKPKFTFKEYIYGPKRKNYYDKMGHEFNNQMIAFVFFAILVFIFMYL